MLKNCRQPTIDSKHTKRDYDNYEYSSKYDIKKSYG